MISASLTAGATFKVGGPNEALAASPVRISATGDWGCTGNTIETVNNIKNQNPDLVLALGDYSYEDTAECWLDVLRPIGSITRINFGNHDVQNSMLLNSYLNSFGLSRQYYSYNIGNVHIVTMSTEDAVTIGSQQYNFVLKDLEAAASNPNLMWIIVSLHEPLYSSPNTCGDSGCSGNKNFRDLFHPLFDKYGVDLVLEGHVHNYERSYPIMYNAKDPSSPIITSCSKDTYDNPNGQIYSIVGTGGVNLHGLSDKAPFMANQQDSKFGILHIQITDNKLLALFISNDGSSMDQFTITKTTRRLISDGNLKEESQNCPGSSPPTSIKSQGRQISSIVVLNEDQTTGELKLDLTIPKIREQIKEKVDKKIQDAKKKVEEKRQEIKARLGASTHEDSPETKDGNNRLEQESQKNPDNGFEELKQRFKDRLKSRLSDQKLSLP
jgi:hypothetical protein